MDLCTAERNEKYLIPQLHTWHDLSLLDYGHLIDTCKQRKLFESVNDQICKVKL